MRSAVLIFAALLFATLPAGAAITAKVTAVTAGPTPFISKLEITFTPVSALPALTEVYFSVKPKTGSLTRPVSAYYTVSYLKSHGYVDTAGGKVTVPVFGLYANYNNTVTLVYFYSNGTHVDATTMVQTAAFNDPTGGQAYLNPTVVQPRSKTESLSYDFIMLKSFTGSISPVIVDSDAQVRWVGTSGQDSISSIFFESGIYLGSGSTLVRMELDGTYKTVSDFSDIGITNTSHHNYDPGKYGFIMDVNGTNSTEDINMEVDGNGVVLKVWNLADIIRKAMIAGGDDPSGFVRPTDDWFHNNATAYWRAYDAVVISSRENFVICIDYNTAAIKWILGDPAKAWHTYPSLAKYGLTLGKTTNPPIGQHALSISGSDLMLFDDGLASFNQSPSGDSRTYSAPRKYAIDFTRKTATEVWHYNANPPIFSNICSSIYEDATNNYLIDYANEVATNTMEIMGLDSRGVRVFDYSYAGAYPLGWNAKPIHLENLVFK